MINNKTHIFDLVKMALWDKDLPNGFSEVTNEDFQEMNQHTISLLLANYIHQIYMTPELKEQWKRTILQQLAYNANYRYMEKTIPIRTPFIILKGSSASQYYPFPEYRIMGDIDLITKREDYIEACNTLLEDGYKEITGDSEKQKCRHRSFKKNGIIIEMHLYFAQLNDKHAAERFDTLLLQNINPSHRLPDALNGLVLLEHISQHLENGLGLRQIIDWMMFVDKCLPDERWPEFEALSDSIGLKTLAIVATKMCVIYLGLSSRKWCEKGDNNLCDQLMNYVLSCGNFGNKRISDEDISQNAFAYANTPRMMFKLLQTRGLANWDKTKRYPILKPLAWIYQAKRYISRGLNREQATKKLRIEYNTAKKRNAMFDALGVKTESKGVAKFKNGKYIKR